MAVEQGEAAWHSRLRELRKHKDPLRAEFADQVVRHLAAQTKDADDSVAAVFDIDMVEDAEGWGLDDLPDAPTRKERHVNAGRDGPQSVKAISESLDAFELLAALQLTEEQKLELMERLKAFLAALFKAMDATGKSRNNDIHRKMILAMAKEGADFPWEERFEKFKELLDAAALAPTIFAHPNRKAFMQPLMKRSELVMADYEE